MRSMTPPSSSTKAGCRYSARDLAVVRAQHARVPIVLGSATPALETLQNIAAGRYQRAAAARRARLRRGRRAWPRRPAQPSAVHVGHVDARGAGNRAASGRRTARCWCSSTAAATRRRYCVRAAAGSRPAASAMRASRCIRRRGGCAVTTAAPIEPLPERCPRCGFAVKPVGQGTERIEETLAAALPRGAYRCAWTATCVRKPRRAGEAVVQRMASRRCPHARGHADGHQGS